MTYFLVWSIFIVLGINEWGIVFTIFFPYKFMCFSFNKITPEQVELLVLNFAECFIPSVCSVVYNLLIFFTTMKMSGNSVSDTFTDTPSYNYNFHPLLGVFLSGLCSLIDSTKVKVCKKKKFHLLSADNPISNNRQTIGYTRTAVMSWISNSCSLCPKFGAVLPCKTSSD